MTVRPRSILGRRAPEAHSDPARTVERLAALLGAGVPASTCWRLLSEDTPDDPVLRAAADAAARGEPVADAISDSLPRLPSSERAAWSATAAGVAVASQAGAPLSDALRVVSERLASVAETGRETEIALAGPRMTTRLVLALPVLGILGSSLLGFDAWAALIGTPYGRIVGAAGVLLLILGALWSRALTRRAHPSAAAPGFSLELLAIAVRGGGALDAARRTVRRECDRHAVPIDEEAIDGCLRLAGRAGAPVSGLLRAEAALLRSVGAADDRRRAAALGVTLLLPLGACVLPAFMLLAVVPSIIAVATSTLSGF
ncbi:type II secretion system F family protein [Naasia lichenicola]|uniref:Type II secretion system protein GspF domain-containing protein n=1 Tax=Naasia lichenicola TaxID=2565933 RepID=A0A4S4FKE0_9MICO|nr:type II secretion system F family protein [Naasia lichenicola]THG30893.1 hypothetical protein E6C64_09735 [Naasia lichenicola]